MNSDFTYMSLLVLPGSVACISRVCIGFMYVDLLYPSGSKRKVNLHVIRAIKWQAFGNFVLVKKNKSK